MVGRRGPGYHKCGSRQDLDWVSGVRVLTPAVRCALDGIVEVRGNMVRYDFTAGGQHYRLSRRVTPRGLTLRAERKEPWRWIDCRVHPEAAFRLAA